MVDWWSHSLAHISPAIVTTHVSLGQAVLQSRFFDMNSPAPLFRPTHPYPYP